MVSPFSIHLMVAFAVFKPSRKDTKRNYYCRNVHIVELFERHFARSKKKKFKKVVHFSMPTLFTAI